MDINEFMKFETNCVCSFCNQCQIKNLKEYSFGSIDYDSCRMKIQHRPSGNLIFIKYQVFDVLGQLPWHIKNEIRNSMNEHEHLWTAMKGVESIYCRQYFYSFDLGIGSQTQPTKILIFRNRLTRLYYAIMLTKSYRLSLKTLSGLKVISQINDQSKIQRLVENKRLPKQLVNFILKLQ